MINAADLALGPMISDGGQGMVFELTDDDTRVLKQYKAGVTVDPDGLVALADWRAGLAGKDLAVIDQHTAWPEQVVAFDDGTHGFLMRKAPASFWHVVEGARVPRDLTYAVSQDAARFVGLRPASPGEAVAVVFQLATVFDVFHRNGVAYGDLSSRNLLWTGGSRPSTLLIDCDAAGVEGAPRALQEAQTPLWDCAWDGVEGRERDEYKLALLFLRLYWHFEGIIGDSTPQVQVPASRPAQREVGELLGAGLWRVSLRPSAADWLPSLRELERGLRRTRAA